MSSGREAMPVNTSANPINVIVRILIWRDHRLTHELTHAGPEDAVREAELSAPSGVVCSDIVSQ
jgi:hypothetical protein